MKRIGLTQRVDFINHYKEKRDALDQNWYPFCFKIDCIPVPLPNLKKNIDNYFKSLKIDVLLLSGGNSISLPNKNISDSAPERDNFEFKLIKFGIKNNIPIIGVCRGMQILNMFFGGQIKKIKNHVNANHKLYLNSDEYDLPKFVNSYHAWSIPKNNLANKFYPVAFDKNGNVECFVSKNRKILGLMWHPERDKVCNEKNINLLKKIIK